MSTPSVRRICLWSGPRNISTALMYSFAQRNDTRVLDEPLYAHYLRQSDAREYHPGADEVLASQENDGGKVIQNMLACHEKPVLFYKHMAHHLLNLDRSFMKEVTNVILTRDPVEMLPSFAKIVPNPTLDDVGYQLQAELLTYLQYQRLPVVVLDAKQVLLDPQIELTRLCTSVGIPFDESMLAWTAGARPEDGVWAKYWYDGVHRSTGFQPYQPKTGPFPDYLRPLLRSCLPYYQQLSTHATRVASPS